MQCSTNPSLYWTGSLLRSLSTWKPHLNLDPLGPSRDSKIPTRAWTEREKSSKASTSTIRIMGELSTDPISFRINSLGWLYFSWTAWRAVEYGLASCVLDLANLFAPWCWRCSKPLSKVGVIVKVVIQSHFQEGKIIFSTTLKHRKWGPWYSMSNGSEQIHNFRGFEPVGKQFVAAGMTWLALVEVYQCKWVVQC